MSDYYYSLSAHLLQFVWSFITVCLLNYNEQPVWSFVTLRLIIITVCLTIYYIMTDYYYSLSVHLLQAIWSFITVCLLIYYVQAVWSFITLCLIIITVCLIIYYIMFDYHYSLSDHLLHYV